jgi:hypothetical protein
VIDAGLARLVALAPSLVDGDLAAALKELVANSLGTYGSRGRHDDVTALALRFRGSGRE